MYDLYSGNDYTVDKWCKQIENFTISDSNGTYKPITSYEMIKITKDDVKFFRKNNKFTENIENEINKLFIQENKSYFFRVSQRSPKDAYLNEYKKRKTYHHSKLLELERLAKEKLNVKTLDEIYTLINKSKRVIEDFKLLIKDKQIDHLYLIFQDWRPSTGIEFRTFIRNKKLIGICLYKSELYSTRTTIPVGLISKFINNFLDIPFIKNTYDNLIIDIYVDNNRVYFIEINPYEKYVSTFTFEWDELNETDNLIVKI